MISQSRPVSLPRIAALCLVLCVSLAARKARAEGTAGGRWATYGGDAASTKYAPLDQINAENVGDLALAWRWKSVDESADLSRIEKVTRQARISNLKATPLMIDGVLYLSTPLYQAAAIDAATGETLWVHDPASYHDAPPAMSIGFNSRGVAWWADGEDRRVLWGTGDGYLIAVDAKDGRPCEGFGERGRVDLMKDLRHTLRGRRDHRSRHDYSVASPPMICRDVVVVPCSISDDPMFSEMPPGDIRGFDVRTGRLLWTFRTIPQAGEPGVETWEDESWRYSGNTNVWTQISADEELGYFYLPVGTPTNDFYGGHRLGDNLYADSLVCLEARTGKKVWHFQTVRHGLWDYDPPCAPNLADITVDGRRIRAVAQVTKQGFTYVFDRVTGEPVWPIEDRPVPASDIPGERAAETQPFPTKPPPFERQGVGPDDLIDLTPALRAEAEEIASHYRTGPLFTPPSLVEEGEEGRKGTIVLPGWGGGANWTGAGFDPETGYLYIPSTTAPIVPELTTLGPDDSDMRYVRKAIGGVPGPQGLPLIKPPWSRITAIDLNCGEIVWQTANGIGTKAMREHEALAGIELPALGHGGKGGPLVTKSLLFVARRGVRGSDAPDDQPALVAYDKADGSVIAALPLPETAMGAPMTYMLEGRQYLALTVLGSPPELVAYALPR